MVTKDFQHAIHRCFQLSQRKGICCMKNKVFLHNLQNGNVKNVSEIEILCDIKKKKNVSMSFFSKTCKISHLKEKNKLLCLREGNIYFKQYLEYFFEVNTLSRAHTLNPSAPAQVFGNAC